MEEERKAINPLIFDEPEKDVEEKIYIILYELNDDEVDDEYNHLFSICIGRTEAYEDIKEKLTTGFNVDVQRSLIMTETRQTESATGGRKYYMRNYADCISVYSFCKIVEKDHEDDKFDIEAYIDDDIPLEEISVEERLAQEHQKYLSREERQYKDMLQAALDSNASFNNIRSMINPDDIKNI